MSKCTNIDLTSALKGYQQTKNNSVLATVLHLNLYQSSLFTFLLYQKINKEASLLKTNASLIKILPLPTAPIPFQITDSITQHRMTPAVNALSEDSLKKPH